MKEKNSNGLGNLSYVMRNNKKYWTGRVSLGIDLNGRQVRRSFSGFKKSEVIEKMQKTAAQGNISGVVDSGYLNLGQAMQYWLFNVKIKEIKTSTIDKYSSTLKYRILPYHISKLKVKDLTIIKIQNHINFLIESGDHTRNMAKDTLGLIKNFLDYCIILGVFPSNPANYVTLPKKTDVGVPDTYKVFSKEEQEKILNHLDLDDVVEQMLFIDFFTGLRRSELRGLQWKNFKGKNIIIDSQMTREYSFTKIGEKTLNKNRLRTLKTESSLRTIPLPEIAINLLNKIKIATAKKYFRIGKEFNGESFIFVDDLCQVIEEKRPNRRLQSICKALNIEKRTLHSIRHSYATRLFEARVDIKTVQQLMGHSDYETTLNIYTHVMPDVKEKAVSIFDQFFSVANK